MDHSVTLVYIILLFEFSPLFIFQLFEAGILTWVSQTLKR